VLLLVAKIILTRLKAIRMLRIIKEGAKVEVIEEEAI
jgi:hypothetical protein